MKKYNVVRPYYAHLNDPDFFRQKISFSTKESSKLLKTEYVNSPTTEYLVFYFLDNEPTDKLPHFFQYVTYNIRFVLNGEKLEHPFKWSYLFSFEKMIDGMSVTVHSFYKIEPDVE